MNQETVDHKIMADLATLNEKMDLCRSFIPLDSSTIVPNSLLNSDTFRTVVGFLEACAPRMVELVEAATTGCLSEHVLMQCLECNDQLTKLLQEIDQAAINNTSDSTTAASAVVAASSASSLSAADHDLFTTDLLLDDHDTSSPFALSSSSNTMPMKSDKSNDPFVVDQNSCVDSKLPPPSNNNGVDSILPTSQSDDAFDDFFNERTSASASTLKITGDSLDQVQAEKE
jgi:hypothetical protein